MVRIWNFDSTQQIEQLVGHRNGVTQIAVVSNQIITGSFDHYIMQWDCEQIFQRLVEKQLMREEDILARRIETYNRFIKQKKEMKN